MIQKQLKRICAAVLACMITMQTFSGAAFAETVNPEDEYLQEPEESEEIQADSEPENEPDETEIPETEPETEESEQGEVSEPVMLTASRDEVLAYVEVLGGDESEAFYAWEDSLSEAEYNLLWIARFGVTEDQSAALYGTSFDTLSDEAFQELLNHMSDDEKCDAIYSMTFEQYRRYVSVCAERNHVDPGEYREFSSDFSYDPDAAYEDPSWNFGVKRHILRSINPAYIPEVTEFVIADLLDYRTTYVKTSAWVDQNGDGTIDLYDVLDREGYEEDIYTSLSTTYFYLLSEDAAFYVAYMPVEHDSPYPMVEFDVAANNNDGQRLPYYFDRESSLLYIERGWFDAAHAASVYESVRTQSVFLAESVNPFSIVRNVPVTVSVTANADEIPDGLLSGLFQGYVTDAVYQGTVSLKLYEGDYRNRIGANNLKVYLNGIETDAFSFDAGTGVFRFGYDPSAIYDLHIEITGFSDPSKEVLPLTVDSICASVTGNMFSSFKVTKVPSVGDVITFGLSEFVWGSNLNGLHTPNVATITYTPTKVLQPGYTQADLEEYTAQLGTFRDGLLSYPGLSEEISKLKDQSDASILQYLSDKTVHPFYPYGTDYSTYDYTLSGKIYANGEEIADVPAGAMAKLTCTHVTAAEGSQYLAGPIQPTNQNPIRAKVIRVTAPGGDGHGYIYIAIASDVYANLNNGYFQAQYGVGRLEYITEPPTGYLQVQKTSSNPDFSAGNRCYRLDGVKFHVYSDQKLQNLVCTLTSGQNGLTEKKEVANGTYYIVEDAASAISAGWAKPEKAAVSVTVTAAETASKPVVTKFSNTPNADPVGLLLTKKDAGTGEDGRPVER